MLKKRAPKIGPGAKVGVCSVVGEEEPELVALREEISCRITAAHLPPERRLPRSAPRARATAAAPTSAPLLGLARGWARILSWRRTMVHADPTKKRKGRPTARRSSYPSGPPSRRNGIPPIHPNFPRCDYPLVGLERSRRIHTRPAQGKFRSS